MGDNQVKLRDLNQHTSAILRRVEHGETLTITNQGRAVARLVPVADQGSGLADHLASGRVIAPTISSPFTLPPDTHDDINVASELVADRENERW